MLKNKPVLSALELCCPKHCANEISDVFQISAQTENNMARPRFAPESTAWEIFS